MESLIIGILVGVIGIVGLYVSGLSKKVIAFIEEKTGYDISPKTEEKINAVLLDAIAYAEEFAAKQVKAGMEKVKGSEKMQKAITYFNKIADFGFDDEKIAMMIEAKLAQIIGVGSTDKKSI